MGTIISTMNAGVHSVVYRKFTQKFIKLTIYTKIQKNNTENKIQYYVSILM